jgi:hypothetical protein
LSNLLGAAFAHAPWLVAELKVAGQGTGSILFIKVSGLLAFPHRNTAGCAAAAATPQQAKYLRFHLTQFFLAPTAANCYKLTDLTLLRSSE